MPLIQQYVSFVCHNVVDLINIGVGSFCFHSQSPDHRLMYDPMHALALANVLCTQLALRCIVLNACSSILAGHILRFFAPFTVRTLSTSAFCSSTVATHYRHDEDCIEILIDEIVVVIVIVNVFGFVVFRCV